MGRPTGGLGEKLNYLFANMRTRDGKEYSNEHVATAVRAVGVKISQSYIWQLRRGMKDNPTLRHLQALADFFGVPAAYFFDDKLAGQVEEQLELIRTEQARLNEAHADRDVRLMAMRAGELSADRRHQMMDLLDIVYRLEQAEREGTTSA
jgi:transcriptional regulator with XRE-family HTH domain